MTDRPRPYHRAEAERLLDYADEWTAQAGELSPEASELSCLAYAAVHALLAIHDTLTAADRYAANEARQREVEPETPEAAEWLSLNEDDPLDEDDHRDRMDCDGDLWGRNLGGCWHTRILRTCRIPNCEWTLAHLDEHYGPLAFAPDTTPQATDDDLTASEGESGSVEGEGADDAQKAILCPECGHDLEDHCEYCCGCTRSPAGVVYALIEQAVNIERTRMTAQLRLTTSSAQDSGDLAELDALADAWEAGTDGGGRD